MDCHAVPPSPSALISPAYRGLQSQLHADQPGYGGASLGFVPLVARVVRQLGVRELLDYGAGKGRLGEGLAIACEGLALRAYEPAVEAWSAAPAPAEMVACIDVLEHVEPECLEAVLDDLRRVTRRVGFFTIHTGAALKTLADGRNAHLTQQPAAWWIARLETRFVVLPVSEDAYGICVLATPRAAA